MLSADFGAHEQGAPAIMRALLKMGCDEHVLQAACLSYSSQLPALLIVLSLVQYVAAKIGKREHISTCRFLACVRRALAVGQACRIRSQVEMAWILRR